MEYGTICKSIADKRFPATVMYLGKDNWIIPGLFWPSHSLIGQ
jgi:hypothetical protein